MRGLTADIGAEADAVVSDDFARKVKLETISDAKVRGNINGGGGRGKQADSLVDGDRSIRRHLGTNGTKDAQSHAVVAHGEDFALTGEGDFAATDIKNTSGGDGFVRNDAVSVKIKGDVIVDEDVVGGDDVVAKSDLDFFSSKSGDKLLIILDGVSVEIVETFLSEGGDEARRRLERSGERRNRRGWERRGHEKRPID